MKRGHGACAGHATLGWRRLPRDEIHDEQHYCGERRRCSCQCAPRHDPLRRPRDLVEYTRCRRSSVGSTFIISRTARSIASSSCVSTSGLSAIGMSHRRHLFFQDAAGFRDAPFHGADGHAEDEADLRIVVVAGSGKEERVAQLARQRRMRRRRVCCSCAPARSSSCDRRSDGMCSIQLMASVSGSAGVTVSRSHRPTLLRRSSALRHVIASSQVRNAASPRKLASFRRP